MTRRSRSVLLIYLYLGAVAALVVVPYIWVLLATLKDNVEIFTKPFSLPMVWHFENYSNAWITGKFGIYYKNTIIVSGLSVLIVLGTVVPAAYAVAKLEFPGRKVVLYVLLLGLIIPFYSIMIPLFYTLRGLKLLNTYLGMVFPMVAIHIAFGIFLMRSFFLSVPRDLMDSARVDGCGELKVFTRIAMPMARSAVTSLAIFQTVWSWNEFLIPLLYSQSDRMRPIMLGMMYFEGRYTTDYSLSMAGAIIVSFPLLVIFLIFNRRFIQGFVRGAFK